MNRFYEHLKNQFQATYTEQGALQFPCSESTQLSALNCHISPLSQQTFILCHGPDAAKFLQGQLTCDINEVTPGQSRLSAHCSPKGRALSSFRILNNEDNHYLLACHHSLRETVQQQLGKYIVFSKAELSEQSDQWSAIGIHGPAAASLLKTHLKTELLTSNQVTRTEDSEGAPLFLVQLDNSGCRFEIWAQNDAMIRLWDTLSPQADISNSSYHELELIRAGLAQLQLASSDQYIPQMLNYQSIDAISFTKGCYTGQEIIARAKYRGQVKRQMIRASINTDCQLEIGQSVMNESKVVGTIVMHAPSDHKGQMEILAVVSNDAAHDQQLHLESTNANGNTEQQKLTVLALPYAIT
jgi:hypothetical protein